MHPLNECEPACEPCEDTIADRLQDIITRLDQINGMADGVEEKLFGAPKEGNSKSRTPSCINDYTDQISETVNGLGCTLNLIINKL